MARGKPMFDYDLIRIETEQKNEEARIAYWQFFHPEEEIIEEIDTEIEEKEIDFSVIDINYF